MTSTDDDGDDDGDGGSRVDAPGLRRFSEGDGGAGSLLTAPAGAMLTAEAAAGPWRARSCAGGRVGGGGATTRCVGAVRAMAGDHDPAMSGGAVSGAAGGGRG